MTLRFANNMKNFRIDKVASVIRQIVSEAIRDRLQDPRVSSMTSVMRVEVSPDLDWARIHVSILGSAAVQKTTMAALTSATGYIQGILARSLHTRQCPRLVFLLDDSLTRGNEVMRIIDDSMRKLEDNDIRNTQATERETQSRYGALPDEE